MGTDAVPEPLRRRYVESFPTKIASLEALLAALDGSAEADAELRGLAHKLAGSAGMYGLDDLGQLARELVHSLDAGAARTEVIARARALIGALERARG